VDALAVRLAKSSRAATGRGDFDHLPHRAALNGLVEQRIDGVAPAGSLQRRPAQAARAVMSGRTAW